MVDVRELLSNPVSQYIAKDEQCTGGEHDAATRERSVYAWLPVKHPTHVDTTATTDTTHVIEVW